MILRKNGAAIVLACLSLVACGKPGDWRKQAIANAEDKMRTEVSDPSATFSDVQVTGNDSTGQICGVISAKLFTGGDRTSRFIVYIDETAGPYVEGNIGVHPVSDDKFVFAWQNDCVKEGYKG